MSGASEKVLGWVKNGVPCYWKEGEPTPWNLGTSMEDATEEEVEWLGRETTRCVEVGAWEEVDSLYCSSRVFLVPKKELDSQGRKKWRLIIDLRPLNVHCQDFKTRYETLAKLGSLIQEGEEVSFLSFDLADAYNCLQIAPEHQRFFGFNLRGRKFQMTALPFGWNQSPYAFTTAMKTLVRLLRSPDLPTGIDQEKALRSPLARSDVEMRYVAGRRVAIWQMPKDLAAARRVFPWDVLPYCDDFLIVVHGRSKLERAVREREAKAVIEGAIERLGLTRQTEKGQWTPGSWIHHLGLRIESEGGSNRIAVTPQRVGRIRKAAKTLLSKAKGNKRLVKARELAGFVGLVQSCYLAIPVAQLFCRELNFDLAEKESWSGSTRLSRQSLRDLEWWMTMPSKWNGRDVCHAAVTRLLWTDASDFAWGAKLYTGKLEEINAEQPGENVPGPETHGALTAEQKKDAITVNEMRAAIWAVEAFLPQLQGCSLRMMQDNQAVMFIVRKLSSKNRALLGLVRRFWALCDLHNIRVKMDYVRSAENPADAPSRWKFDDEWLLAPEVFRMVESRLRVAHTLDLFASSVSKQLTRYVSRFPDPSAEAQDAFSLPSWSGEVLWINCDWDLLDLVAQRLEAEPAAVATVMCPYFPGQLAFSRLQRMASDIVVAPWDNAWASRPGQLGSARIGPSVWQVAFIHIGSRLDTSTSR